MRTLVLLLLIWFVVGVPVTLAAGQLLNRAHSRYPLVRLPRQRAGEPRVVVPLSEAPSLRAANAHRRSTRRVATVGATALVLSTAGVSAAAAFGRLPGPAQVAASVMIEAISPFQLPQGGGATVAGGAQHVVSPRTGGAAAGSLPTVHDSGVPLLAGPEVALPQAGPLPTEPKAPGSRATTPAGVGQPEPTAEPVPTAGSAGAAPTDPLPVAPSPDPAAPTTTPPTSPTGPLPSAPSTGPLPSATSTGPLPSAPPTTPPATSPPPTTLPPTTPPPTTPPPTTPPPTTSPATAPPPTTPPATSPPTTGTAAPAPTGTSPEPTP